MFDRYPIGPYKKIYVEEAQLHQQHGNYREQICNIAKYFANDVCKYDGETDNLVSLLKKGIYKTKA